MKITKFIKTYIWKKDKLDHLILGTCVYLLGEKFFSPEVGLILALITGFAKEIYDQFFRTEVVNGVKVKTNNGEGLDFFATIFLPVIFFLISTL